MSSWRCWRCPKRPSRRPAPSAGAITRLKPDARTLAEGADGPAPRSPSDGSVHRSGGGALVEELQARGGGDSRAPRHRIWWKLRAMSEATPQLSAQEMEELSALADGTLPAERRAAVEARVAASAELRRLLARQRRAVEAVRIAAMSPARIASRRGRPESGNPVPGAAEPGGSPTPCAGGRRRRSGGAARAGAQRRAGGAIGGRRRSVAAQPAPGPPPAPLDRSRTKLAVAVDGAAFPIFGSRTDGGLSANAGTGSTAGTPQSLPTRRATGRSAT